MIGQRNTWLSGDRSTRRVGLDAPDANLSGGTIRAAAERRSRSLTVSHNGVRRRERIFDVAGEPIYGQTVRVEQVVGSGQRTEARLHRCGDLLMYWCTESGEWDLGPSYNPDDPRRFDCRARP